MNDEASVPENEFDINTADIFTNEWRFRDESLLKSHKKLSSALAYDLQECIQHILLKYAEPTPGSPKDNSYMHSHFERYMNSWTTRTDWPFPENYFMVRYTVPIKEMPHRVIRYQEGDYYYMFEYNEQIIITRNLVEEKYFELLFAFTLRHCDLMRLHPFLNYHLEKNFASDAKSFIIFLTQLKRKFVEELFSNHLSDSIDDWLSETKRAEEAIPREKIQSVLTVDQLAYLFKALMDLNLISNENKNRIIAFASRSFSTKMQSDISEGSFNSKFYSPSFNALGFWEDQFMKLSKLAARQKEKYRE